MFCTDEALLYTGFRSRADNRPPEMTRKATEEGWGRHQLALRENGRLDGLVRRSTLIVPVNVPRFLAKAKSTRKPTA